MRVNTNTTLDNNLYKAIKILAIKLEKNANDLIEEGMQLVIDKYNKNKKE